MAKELYEDEIELTDDQLTEEQKASLSEFVLKHARRTYLLDAMYLADSGVPVIAIGHDFGQGYTKSVNMDEQGNCIKHAIPSLISHKPLLQNQDLKTGAAAGKRRKKAEASKEKEPTTFHIAYDNIHYVIGEEAISDGTSGIDDKMRYLEMGFKLSLMAMGSWMFQKLYPKKCNNKQTPREAILYIVTQAPMDVRTDEFANEIIKKQTGTYEFTVLEDDQPVHYRFYTVILEALIEGAGTAIYAGTEGLYGVGDLGRGTCDMLEYHDIEVQEKHSFNIQKGVTTIEDRFNQFFFSKYKRALMQDEIFHVLDGFLTFATKFGYDYDERALDIKYARTLIDQSKIEGACKQIASYMPKLFVQGKTVDQVDLYLLFYKACENVGSEICSAIRAKWGKETGGIVGMQYEKLLFVGGMVFFIRHILKREFPNCDIVDEPEYPGASPQYGNGLGLGARAFSDYLYDILQKKDNE